VVIPLQVTCPVLAPCFLFVFCRFGLLSEACLCCQAWSKSQRCKVVYESRKLHIRRSIASLLTKNASHSDDAKSPQPKQAASCKSIRPKNPCYMKNVNRGQVPSCVRKDACCRVSGAHETLRHWFISMLYQEQFVRAVHMIRHRKLRSSCPCFMKHEFNPGEFHVTCCRDKFYWEKIERAIHSLRVWYTSCMKLN